MIEFRYERLADSYIPQYKSKDEVWKDFKKGTFLNPLKSIAYDLAVRDRGYNCECYDADGTVYFKSEIYVSAFLGAAMIYYTNEIKSFSL